MFESTFKALDALKLPADQHSEVIARLQAREHSPRLERRSAKRRYHFDGERAYCLQVTHPGGSDISLQIYPRDLSEVGLGFLHSNFLYPNSTCTIWFYTIQGEPVPVSGHIARCELVMGRIHDVGMAFDEELSISGLAGIHEEAGEKPKQRRKWRKPA